MTSLSRVSGERFIFEGMSALSLVCTCGDQQRGGGGSQQQGGRSGAMRGGPAGTSLGEGMALGNVDKRDPVWKFPNERNTEIFCDENKKFIA